MAGKRRQRADRRWWPACCLCPDCAEWGDSRTGSAIVQAAIVEEYNLVIGLPYPDEVALFPVQMTKSG